MVQGNGKTDIAWVTCRELPEPDVDEQLTLTALERAGLSVAKLAWDDPGRSAPGRFRACVLRSCWNYYEDPQRFSNWLQEAASASLLWNGLRVARWNLHKRYLAVLAEGGVPIVPTLFLERGSAPALGALVARAGWGDVVIKPAVSAGSFATRRFGARDLGAGQVFLDTHLAQRDMLAQCFVPSVETVGEKCLIWIDGDFTHAIRKEPRFSEDDERVSAALPVEGADERLGREVLRVACEAGGFRISELLYARVDTVEWEGRRVLSELELLEPSLFLKQAPAALERFVTALARRVRSFEQETQNR